MELPELPVDLPTINVCVEQAANTYSLDPVIIKALIAVEGGRIGTKRQNKDGTHDYGIMQVNSTNFGDIKKGLGFTEQDLLLNPCKNIMAGAWLLWQRLKNTKHEFWTAVATYHSKTPRFRDIYKKNVKSAYARLAPAIGTKNEAKAIGRTTDWGKARPLEEIVGSIQKARQPTPKVISINSERRVLRFID